jgi:DNA-directed RNA polymerase specialized sigma24 family protein
MESGLLVLTPDVQQVQKEDGKRERALTEVAFNRLLEWLDGGVDSQGEAYLEVRRRLVVYFDRRNRQCADELADETLNRVARTLQAGGTIAITPPARYCYVVARFVLLEDIRRDRRHVRLDEPHRAEALIARGTGFVPAGDEIARRELGFECLDRCLEELRPDQRELVVEYYRDTRREKIDRRRDAAARLGISMNALRIRACRIRDSLESCVTGCRRRLDREP